MRKCSKIPHQQHCTLGPDGFETQSVCKPPVQHNVSYTPLNTQQNKYLFLFCEISQNVTTITVTEVLLQLGCQPSRKRLNTFSGLLTGSVLFRLARTPAVYRQANQTMEYQGGSFFLNRTTIKAQFIVRKELHKRTWSFIIENTGPILLLKCEQDLFLGSLPLFNC